LAPRTTERASLALARWLTIALGAFGTATAVLLAVVDVKFIWDAYLQVVGLFGGGLAGLFALGIFSRRANGPGAFGGALVAAGVVFAVTRYTDLHFFLYGGIGILSCMIFGYLLSLILPQKGEGRGHHSIWRTNGGPGPSVGASDSRAQTFVQK